MKTTNTFNIGTYFLSLSIILVICSIIENSITLFFVSFWMIIIVISCILIRYIFIKKNKAKKEFCEKLGIVNFIKLEKKDLEILPILIQDFSYIDSKYNYEGVSQVDIGIVVNYMFNDIKNIDSLCDIDVVFNESYYTDLVKYLFASNIDEIIRVICKSRNKFNESFKIHERVLKKIITSVPEMSNLKLHSFFDDEYKIKARSTINNFYILSVDFHIGESADFDILKKNYLYILDALTSSVAMTKILFIINKINLLDKKSEFLTILDNMFNEIHDIDMIVQNVKPIYLEFYQRDLGFLQDDVLLSLSIQMILNRIHNKSIRKEFTKTPGIDKLTSQIKSLIDKKAMEFERCEIKNDIIDEILNTCSKNTIVTYINILKNFSEWEDSYNEKYLLNNNQRKKERYLKGDFKKEKQQLIQKYSLTNITTGSEFELYLGALFKDLGYKVKHTGKTGDQGCDLILKKKNCIYAVQAKFYTGKLSNTPIQEVFGSLKYYNANRGVVITNSSFTSDAKKLAKVNNVILIDGDKLNELIEFSFDYDKQEDILQNVFDNK